jgi:hypothetical protein
MESSDQAVWDRPLRRLAGIIKTGTRFAGKFCKYRLYGREDETGRQTRSFTMRKEFIAATALFCFFGLCLSASAFNNMTNLGGTDKPGFNAAGDQNINCFPSKKSENYVTIVNMIGDNDGYGYGRDIVPDGADLPITNNPEEGAGWIFDNRTADELAATNGAQGTDFEEQLDVTFNHRFNLAQFDYLTEAFFTIDISGLQQGVFGGFSHLYLDGQEVADFLDIDQGVWGSGLFTYAVDLSMLADGALDVYFDGWDSQYGHDDIAIDFASLSVTGVSPIPEPTTMVLFGLGLVGLGAYGRRKE